MHYSKTKLFPWHVAQARQHVIGMVLMPMVFYTTFLETWVDVYRVR